MRQDERRSSQDGDAGEPAKAEQRREAWWRLAALLEEERDGAGHEQPAARGEEELLAASLGGARVASYDQGEQRAAQEERDPDERERAAG